MFAARHGDNRGSCHVSSSAETCAPCSGHYHDPAGILERSLISVRKEVLA
nr:MAG TPA_asm: hypothetical protein [Caudoviricetes sp.]DAY67299.1 MAG TPA: hypothetical protein [Caudoviricetes sp.]